MGRSERGSGEVSTFLLWVGEICANMLAIGLDVGRLNYKHSGVLMDWRTFCPHCRMICQFFISLELLRAIRQG